MAQYNGKNYMTDGGDTLHIGGTLEVADGASVTFPAATTEAAGIVKMAANVAKAASTAPTKAEFDALIDALVAAGIMASAS